MENGEIVIDKSERHDEVYLRLELTVGAVTYQCFIFSGILHFSCTLLSRNLCFLIGDYYFDSKPNVCVNRIARV